MGGLTAEAAAATAHGLTLLQAGCNALLACTQLATTLRLSSEETVRVASACRLLLEAGAAMLRAGVSDAGALANTAGRESASIMITTMASVIYFLAGSGGTPPSAKAAFAAGVGKPAALVPWLEAVTAALLVSCEQRNTEVSTRTLYHYTLVLESVVLEPAFAAHAQALAAQPQLTAAAVRLLLRHALPALAAAATADVLLGCAVGSAAEFHPWLPRLKSVLAAPGVRAVVVSSMGQPGSAAVVQQSAQLVLRLPVLPPDGVPHARFVATHKSAVQILAQAAYGLNRAQEARLAATSSGGSSTAGSSSGAADGLVASASGADSSSGSGVSAVEAARACEEELLAAGCSLVDVVPRLAAVIEGQAAAAGSSGCNVSALATLCDNLATALLLTRHKPRFIAPPARLAAWLAAAQAAIQLQPLLCQLDSSFRQLADQTLQLAAVHLSSTLMCDIWRNMPPSMMLRGAADLPGVLAEVAAAQESLPAQLWQLHSSSCRLVHWLAADSSRQLAAARHEGSVGSVADVWSFLLFGLHHIFHRAHDLMCSTDDEQAMPAGSGDLPTQALCAAHAEAVQILAPLARGFDGRHITAHNLLTASAAMLAVADSSPASVGANFLVPVQLALAALPQGSVAGLLPSHQPHFCVLAQLVRAAAAGAGHLALAAVLATSGLLGEAVEAAARLGDDEAGSRQEMLLACHGAVVTLQQGAESVHCSMHADAASWAGVDAAQADGAAGQLAAVEGRLAALLDCLAVADSGQQNGVGVGQLRQLLQPAQDTGAALFTLLALPFVAKLRAVSVAEAAVARSCAYLRCSNVALLGGPAAKQGQGCKRCGGCKAAYYCSTACSHADWSSMRHKGRCKALAAALAAAAAAAASD